MATEQEIEMAFHEGYQLGREQQKETRRRLDELTYELKGGGVDLWVKGSDPDFAEVDGAPCQCEDCQYYRSLKEQAAPVDYVGGDGGRDVEKMMASDALKGHGASLGAMYAKMQPAAPDPRIAKLERIASLARSIHDHVNNREFGQFVNHLRSEGWHEQVTSDLVDLRNLFANKPV